MSSMAQFGLLTPPSSPERRDERCSAGTAACGLHNLTLFDECHKPGSRSCSMSLLTPPKTPAREVLTPRRAMTLRDIPQTDGSEDVGLTLPSTPRRTPRRTTATEQASGLPHTRVSAMSGRPQPHIDLTSPRHCPFPTPAGDGLDTPTPLARALPAEGAFPFPIQQRRLSALTPLALRRSRPQSLPGRRPLPSSPFRPRRFSGADRFIPERSSPNAISENFRLSRPPERLTHHERATRRQPSGSDPFRYRPQRPSNTAQTPTTTRIRAAAATGANSIPLNPQRGFRANGTRQVSGDAVWGIGAVASVGDNAAAVHDGRGGLLGSGTNAPLFTARFLTNSDALCELDLYERRLALAFDIDQSSRVLGSPDEPTSRSTPRSTQFGSPHEISPTSPRSVAGSFTWQDSAWTQDAVQSILDAPSLRDDFYCSLLAYSATAKTLAVGLGNHVYLWSEGHGVDTPESLNVYSTSHVTSVGFSSTPGDRAILAVGRADGRVVLWSPLDNEFRFNAKQQNPICCLAFRPNTVKRPSTRDPHVLVDTEELLIGDELGKVNYYSIEWPNAEAKELFDWQGSLTLLACISVHDQQVCGIAWSHDGAVFATGGNDNLCALFETRRILHGLPANGLSRTETLTSAHGDQSWAVVPNTGPALVLPSSRAKHRWILKAAVKAIAFCPWQRGLIAIGGGSNDRCIHFYHTISGACLATIDCHAQVTSLIWSTTRREICATFGFAQPEHLYRIAVFAWPSCEQVVAIPWTDEHRALYAIPYPGGPNAGRKRGEGGQWWQRTADEGCVVVATSDASIKFHEVWSEERRATVGGPGLLGGSDILESLHGVDQRGNEAIR